MPAVVLAGGLTFGVCPLAALAGGPPAQDLAPLQRPSRPMIEVAQQHYQAGERFLSSGDCLRLSRRCSRRHGSPRARVAVVTLVPP